MTELTTTNLIEKTVEMLHAVQGSLIQVSINLSQIKSGEEWKQYSDNWGHFCEDTLGMSQSQASKLISIHTHFIEKGGMSPDQLVGIDYEKLNAARSLGGTVEEQVAKAKTLSRKDLRDERVDEGHIHGPETVEIYKCCGMRKND